MAEMSIAFNRCIPHLTTICLIMYVCIVFLGDGLPSLLLPTWPLAAGGILYRGTLYVERSGSLMHVPGYPTSGVSAPRQTPRVSRAWRR